jgi:hypothetical protein
MRWRRWIGRRNDRHNRLAIAKEDFDMTA